MLYYLRSFQYISPGRLGIRAHGKDMGAYGLVARISEQHSSPGH